MSAEMAQRALLLVSVAVLLTLLPLVGCGREAAKPPIIPEAGAVEAPADDAGEQAEAPEPSEEASGEQPAAAAVETAAEPLAEGATQPPEAGGPSLGARVLAVLKAIGIFLGKVLFVAIMPTAIAATLLGLPGGVLVLANATVYSALHGWASPPWWVLIIVALIALGAELAESALSFAGVKQSGASNKTGLWVLVGGFTGAVVGGALGPLLATAGALAGPVGWGLLSVLPPIGLGMLGGFLGGYFFELRTGKTPEEARSAGWGALLGRVAGSFTKAMLVAVMGTVVLIASWGTLF